MATDAMSGNGQSGDALGDLGPVDYLVVEFPPGRGNFTGEMGQELLRLTEAGIVRVLDLLILQKDMDGSVQALEVDEVGGFDDVRSLETRLAELLAAEDVELLAEAMEPGSTAGVVVWENAWAAPFAAAARRAGGQLVATDRIPIQAILASLEADLEDFEDLMDMESSATGATGATGAAGAGGGPEAGEEA